MGWGINAKTRPIYLREWLSLRLIGAGWAQVQFWTSASTLASTWILSPDCPIRAVLYTDYAIPAYST
jgi:hypothetical protein